MLRMDSSVSPKKKRERVTEVLNEFNLEICKNVKIGLPGRIKGISGGQKRRLAFATEVFFQLSLLIPWAIKKSRVITSSGLCVL